MWKKRGCSLSVRDVVMNNLRETDEEMLLHDTRTYQVRGLDRVAEVILDAKKNHKRINVFADYDADGATSAAVLSMLLEEVGVDFTMRLPRRFSEGYGIKESAIDEMDGDILITVDNGISAVKPVQKAKEKGMYVIILDHHLAPADGVFPDADIMIDPNAIAGQADFCGYCGAGLSLKLAELMLGEDHPIMDKLYALASIGTVADVMDLVKDNRNIVKRGLAALSSHDTTRVTKGLIALVDRFDMNHVGASDIGFRLGPAINAPGRLEDTGATRSYQTISYDEDFSEADRRSGALIEINEKRKKMVQDQCLIAEQVIEDGAFFADNPLVIYHESFHEGIIGIIAGRLVEKYHVPAFVFTQSKDSDVLKGSARSCGGIHLKELMDRHSELFVGYGGHAEAAGMSVKADNLDELRAVLNEDLSSMEMDEVDTNVYYDMEIGKDDIFSMYSETQKYGPYGNGNPEPVFLIKNFQLFPRQSTTFKAMGDGTHVKLFGNECSAVGFGMYDKYIEMGRPDCIDIVGTISLNEYMGKSEYNILINDFRKASSEKKMTRLAQMLSERAKNR